MSKMIIERRIKIHEILLCAQGMLVGAVVKFIHMGCFRNLFADLYDK